MTGPRRIAVAAFAALLVTAPAARADEYCVGDEPQCLPTLAEALTAARSHDGPDRVLLRAGEHDAPAGHADAAGEPVEIIGAGTATRIAAAAGATSTLWLAEPGSRATALTIDAPAAGATESLLLAGVAARVVVSAPAAADAPAVRMLPGARLADALVNGAVIAAAPARIERSVLTAGDGVALTADGGVGSVVAENTEIHLRAAGAALDARCAGVVARHLTIVGAAAQAITAACAEEVLVDLRNSVLHGDFDEVATTTGAARVESRSSMHAADDGDVVAIDRLQPSDPAFVSETDLRPREGSPLVDAGEPGVLAAGEGFSDRGSRTRVADGNGDGQLRRDVGAHELQPPPPPVPAGNVLFNPGAEQGASILTTGEGAEPPGWTRTGAFTQVGYGAAARTAQGADIALPSREIGEALGAGAAFFSAGPGEAGRLLQRIDVTGSSREIDAGVGSAALSALVGGYGADEDEVRVTATFRDPEGVALSALTLGPVSAADRGNATNLVPRDTAGAIPARTRAIDVEISGTRVSAPGSAESYADAYADNLALVLSVPGVAVQGPVDPGTTPPVKNLKPFAGITVLTGRPKLSRRGRTRIGIACASATVGRCAGTLELRAQLRRGLAFTRIAQFARFSLGPGRSATVTMKLTMAARRALRRAKSFRATLRAVVQDGQGLERRTTIPIRVMRSGARRRR